MATGSFTGFPINWNDSLAAFGIVAKAGDTMTGALNIGTSANPALDARSSTNGYYVYGRNSTTGHYAAFASDATGPRIEFGNGTGLRIGDGAADRIWVGSTGNLGVGATPTSKLTVQGNYLTCADGTYIGYFGKASDVVVGAGTADLGIRTSTGHICFGTSTGAERMRIESGGGIVEYQPHRFGQFTLSTLPSASAFSGYCIDVTNASGGAKICRSNGTVWQILNTTTTVS